MLYQRRAVQTALWQRKLTIRVAARLIKESPVAVSEILDADEDDELIDSTKSLNF